MLLAVPNNVSAAAPDMLGNSGWTAVMYGASQDPQGDSQAGAADTDIVADATHGSLYVGYSDGGAAGISDDYLYFRIRVDNPSSPGTFGGVAVVGMDANLDGALDLFMMVDARNSSQSVRLMDPGTGANISPSTTTTSPLPTGWLANNGVYSFSVANFSSVAVSATTDPHWNGDDDLGNDGKVDVFSSWRVPLVDLSTVLAIPSPTDRNGVYGPRGSTGIAGFDQNTLVRYIAFTQTQSGPINGDLNGVGASYDKNATFASLGAFTAPMSAANPVSASDAVTITEPVSATGYINGADDNAYTVSGTTTPVSSWVRLTVSDTDGGTADVVVWVQSDGLGAWSATPDLSTLEEGTLTFTAVLVDGNGSNTIVANSSGDTSTAIHDTLAPTVSVNSVATSGFPTISGTSADVPAGSIITVSIDPNGDGVLTDAITYSAVVDGSGNWTVNTAVVSPTTGTMPSSGLTAYATVTATGSDAAGNSTTTTAVTQPTVTVRTTNDTTPTITGTWGGSNGGTDTLSVTVNGVTYTDGDGNLTVTGNTWSLTIPPGDALTTGGSPYNVTTTVTRSGTPYSNTTTAAITVVSGPSVSITSSASQADSTPVITGTSTIISDYISVRIDPNNDGNFADAIYYSFLTDGSGNWSLDTDTAVPVSGTYPLAGITGAMGILVTVTDGDGTQATASQTLTVTIPTITITTITSTATGDATGDINNADTVINGREDDAITVSGTSTSADGLTVTVTVSDGDTGTTDPSGTATVAVGGAWSVTGLDLSALRTGYLTFTASVTGASDTDTSYTHDKAVPVIMFTTPSTIDKNSGSSGSTVTGTSDLVAGSIISVQFGSDGSTNATVGANGDWSVTQSLGTLGGSSVTITATPAAGATDAAGNKPAAAITNSFALQASFVPLSGVVVINAIATDNIITTSEAGSVVISGTSTMTNGAPITVTITNAAGTQVVSTSTTVSGGTWSTTAQDFSSTTPNGPLTVVARGVGSDGKTYTDATIATLFLGTVAAGATPTITITTVGDSNLSSSEDDSVTIAGITANVPASTTVSITVSDTDGGTADVTGTATTDGSGNWTTSLNLSSLIDGTLTVSVSVTANSQTATDTATVGHDTSAATITITSGPSNGDSTPVLSGTTTLPVGATITVSIDLDNDGTTDLTYTTTVQTGGTWSVDTGTETPATGTFPANGIPGSATVTASGADAAGNVSSISSTSITSISSDNGVSSTDFITNDPTLIFSGRGGTNLTVSLTLTNSAGTTILSTTAPVDANGNWTYDFTGTSLAADTYTLIATVTSGGSSSTGVQSFTIDTVTPSSAISNISGDSGTAGDFITNDPTLSYSGTADNGTSVVVTLKDSNNATIFTSTVTPSGGNWSVDQTGSTLPDGTYTLTVVTTDSAGNTTTNTQTIVIDTTSEISINTNATTSDTTPVISGTSDLGAGRTVTITISGATYTVTTDADGNWTVDLGTDTPSSGTLTPLTDGNTYTITVSGTDAAGNLASASKSLTIDSSAPTLTITEPLDGGGGDGILDATEDNSVTIQGTSTFVPSGSTVSVTITDGSTTINDTATVDGSGNWSLSALNLSSLANGVITVTVTYVNGSGSSFSDTATVDHDKTGTTAIDAIGTDTGVISDFITFDNTLTFSGSAGASASVLLTATNSLGVIFSTTVTADGDGNWSYDFTGTVLAEGTYTLIADSGTVATQSFTVDITDPAGPVAVNAQVTNSTTPTITGTVTLVAGDTFTVTVNGVTYTLGDGNLSTNGLGDWELVIPPANALDPATGNGGFNGEYTVTATITDTAGNTLPSTSTVTVTVFPTLTAATGGGAISADNFGSGTFVTLTGPIYEEGVSGDVGSGTIILTAPAGFEFDTGGVAPTVLITGGATATDNINDLASGTSAAVTSVTASQITFTVTAESLVANTLTWQNIRVRPTAGTPLATGNVTLDATSTSTLTDVTAGTTSFGALTEVAGTANAYKITAASATVTAGGTDQLTITQVDQYGNTVTGFSGDVALTFSGLATSPAGNISTVTDKDANAINLGTATTITFVNGVSTVGGLLTVYAAEGPVTLHATDGTRATSSTGGSGASLTISAGAASAYRITAATTTPTAGATDVLTIKQVDQYGNTVTTFNGDANLTFSGLANATTGEVPTVTDKTGTAIDQGTPTTITFTSGVATAGGTLIAYKAESATLHATDGTLATTDTGGTGAALTVGAGAASAYRITAATTTPNAGAADALTIRQVDQYGNTVTGLNGDVALTFSGLGTSDAGNVPTVTDKTGTAINQGTATTITFTSGVGTAGGSLVAYKAETATLNVSDGTLDSTDTGGAGVTLTVGGGAASAYRITAATTTPSAGAADALTIRQVDQFGNTVTGFSGDVALTFSGLGTADAGNVPTVTDKTGTAINQGTATTITFTSGVSTAGGSLVAYKAETATLHATDGTLSTTDTGGTGVTLTVSAGAASAYRIAAATTTPTAGAADALTIRQVDQYGNTVTGFSGDVALTFSGLGTSDTGNVPTVTDKTGTAINQGTATTITFTSGVSTAGGSLVAYKAETATLHATDGTLATTDTGGTGVALTVGAGAASAYRITAATTTPTAGAADALTIRQVDQYGNTVTGLSGDVALTFSGLGNSPGGAVPTVTDKTGAAINLGTATTITFTSGVNTAGGTLVAYKAETATLHTTDGTYSTSTAGGAGVTLTVGVGAADRLVFSTQPNLAEINVALEQQPVVKTADPYGNFSTVGLPASLVVTITLSGGSGTLSGTTTLDIGTGAGNGTVTYTDLQVDTAGAGAQFTASAPGMISAVSNTFNVWTILMVQGDRLISDRGPYFTTGTILLVKTNGAVQRIVLTSIKDPYEIALEADGNILVADYESTQGGGLFRIDKLTLAITTVSSGGDFVVPFGVKVETKAPNAGQILVADLDAFSQAGAIFRVDPNTGAQTTLTQGDNFYFLQGLEIAPTGTPNDGDIYVTSVGDGAAITSKLIRVDPSTGVQTIISEGQNFNYPTGLAVESDGQIVVVDAKAMMVIRVDPSQPSNSNQTVLSDGANAGQGIAFIQPTHVVIDGAGNLWVTDAKVNAGANERDVFIVNKTTGNRTLISQDGFFEQPRGITLVP
ncbi:MAG: Ig-like domain-containing protein [Verrucomicrobiota bacterium]